MPDPHHPRHSTASRRIGQFGVIAMAVLGSSSTGLLAYINQPSEPAWLTWVISASAAAVVISLIGWVGVRLVESARGLLQRSRPASRL